MLDFLTQWGGLTSALGLVVTAAGFWLTIRLLLKSKSAAEAASDAVGWIKSQISGIEDIQNLSYLISSLEETRRLQRAGDWTAVLGRYAAIRKGLVRLRASATELRDEYGVEVRSAIRRMYDFEQTVEMALDSNTVPRDVAKLNRMVSEQIDTLEEILIAIKQDIGG